MMPTPKYPQKFIIVLVELSCGAFSNDQDQELYDYVIRVKRDGSVTIEGEYLNNHCNSLSEAVRLCEESLLLRQTMQHL